MNPKKIVLILRDQPMASIISRRFSEIGIEVTHVADLAQIIVEIERVHPDLLILDVDIVGVDGFAVFESLRGNVDTTIAGTPVIIASATGDIVEIGHALRLGIKDYFVKSKFNIEEVVEKVTHQLGVTAPVKPEEVKAPSKQSKVLIIEDDKFLRDLAMQKLTRENFQVFAAMDGEQGVVMAEKEVPDIILLDILLPGIDGYEVLRRVRENPTLKKVSIAMLSNFGQREDIEKALTSGADQFLVKANYTLDEIVEEVKKMVTKVQPAA